MSLRNDVLHSLKWLAGARFAGQLIAWAVTLVVIRILRPSDYGLMAIAEVLIGFALLFQELGLYSAMVQKRDLSERQVEQTFGILLVVNCVIYLVVFVGAPWFAAFFDDPRLVPIVRVLGIQFPLASIGVVQDAMLSRSMNFRRKSFVKLAAVLGNGITTLVLALSGAGVWALVYGSLAGGVIRPAGLVLAARHWCRPRFSRKGMSDMLRFGSFVTGSRITWYVYSRADVFIIGKLLGNELLGFYSIAKQLASLPMQKVGELLNQVGLAAYALVQEDMDALRSHFCKVVRVLSFSSFPVFWGISCVSPDLVSVVFGQRWEQAAIPLQLLSLIMPLRMLSQGLGVPLEAIGKPHINTMNHVATLVVMVPALSLGAWSGGLIGASLAWVIVYPVVILVRLRSSLPPLGLNMSDFLRAMAGPAAGGTTMYVAVMFVRMVTHKNMANPVLDLAIQVVTGAVVYAAFMWFVRRRDCREMLALLRK